MFKSTAKSNSSPLPKRKWLFWGAVVSVLLVVAVLGLAIFTLVYEKVPNDMLAVANQFKPDPTWQMKAEHIEPRRVLCIDVECPSMWRQWETESLLSYEDLSELLSKANWDLRIEGTCKLDDLNRYGDNIEACSASGIVNGYLVSIYVNGSNPVGNNSVQLNIKARSDS